MAISGFRTAPETAGEFRSTVRSSRVIPGRRVTNAESRSGGSATGQRRFEIRGPEFERMWACWNPPQHEACQTSYLVVQGSYPLNDDSKTCGE